MLLENFPF